MRGGAALQDREKAHMLSHIGQREFQLVKRRRLGRPDGLTRFQSLRAENSSGEAGGVYPGPAVNVKVAVPSQSLAALLLSGGGS